MFQMRKKCHVENVLHNERDGKHAAFACAMNIMCCNYGYISK